MIGAIIVTYNPNFKILHQAIKALQNQVNQICIIDNSSFDYSDFYLTYDNIKYFPLKKNIGIASAQNIGIQYFESVSYKFVLFSDQDSIAPDHIVENLYKSYKEISRKIPNIATIGPLPINRTTGKEYIYKRNIKKRFPPNTFNVPYTIYEMHSIISSLSFTKLSTFKEIGYFEEKLFIDGVDNEWCWRSFNKAQLRTFLVYDLQFSHFQGYSESKSNIKKSNPFRIYYQYRNFIILSKRAYSPLYWKLENAIKFLIKLFYYPCFVSPRVQFLKRILHGCIDGFKNNY